MLGLDTGGSCRGVLYTVAAAEIDSELEIVWRREMVTAAYRPSWVVARTESGSRRAIAFLINHAHPRYAGHLGETAIVNSLARACGPLGDCADYLFRTTEHLGELGIVDRSLFRLVGWCGRRKDAWTPRRHRGLSLAPDRALVPAPQQQVLQQGESQEDQDPGQGDQHQGREHARDVEPVAGLEDAVGEARAGAGGAGRELGHDGADQRQAAARCAMPPRK